MGKRYCRLLFALATCQPVLPSYSLAGVAQNYRHGLAVETQSYPLSPLPIKTKAKGNEDNGLELPEIPLSKAASCTFRMVAGRV